VNRLIQHDAEDGPHWEEYGFIGWVWLAARILSVWRRRVKDLRRGKIALQVGVEPYGHAARQYAH
jgi:hypothetical protein